MFNRCNHDLGIFLRVPTLKTKKAVVGDEARLNFFLLRIRSYEEMYLPWKTAGVEVAQNCPELPRAAELPGTAQD